MKMEFKNKVVLVTGGARGIGKAIAKIFLQNGAKVFICDKEQKLCKNSKRKFGENSVIFNKCDVSKDEDFQAAYSECENKFKGLDILVNNAGIVDKDIRKLEAVNFKNGIAEYNKS
ncbi:Short-chain dehydrogenase reductase 3b [Armadillidium nasatum]|uniref:Short-chain dehydrogenase reductase 3b n=1 Tax=Armadillidium nasatum TaxID=96803 RepID=A0A5N5TJ57_9CRUS|nr:Short-chain dehydrogenase reductase 3b [Armadillidium nasatum]